MSFSSLASMSSLSFCILLVAAGLTCAASAGREEDCDDETCSVLPVNFLQNFATHNKRHRHAELGRQHQGLCVTNGSTFMDCTGEYPEDAIVSFTMRMKQVYPYTEHKGLDWDALGEEFRAQVHDALLSGDSFGNYLRVVKDLTIRIHDGHVEAHWDDTEERCAQDPTQSAKSADIGAGFAVDFGRNSDNQVIVAQVLDEYPGGLHAGDVVTKMCPQANASNCIDIETYLLSVNIRWVSLVPATTQALDAERLRYASRAPAGTHLIVELQDGRQIDITATTNVAEVSRPYLAWTESEKTINCIRYELLPNNYGYLRVGTFDSCTGFGPAIEEAIAYFKNHNASKMIVDLRGNGGGDDENVPELMSYFYSHNFTYERVATVSNSAPGAWEVKAGSNYTIFPKEQARRWGGSVSVMVNRGVMSNGDMAAFCFQQLGADIVGSEGTSGSVSMAGGVVKLPCLQIDYTLGRSLDAAGQVQLEANANFTGGVQLSMLVESTPDNLMARASFGRNHSSLDVELDFCCNGCLN